MFHRIHKATRGGQKVPGRAEPTPAIHSPLLGRRVIANVRKRSSSTSSAELRGLLVDSVKHKYAK
ncbi:hypothetical protein E4U52_000473, partial [Claviceps spartinae]